MIIDGFIAELKIKEGQTKPLYLKRAMNIKICIHLKIKAKANYFDPFYREYFEKREQERQKHSQLQNGADRDENYSALLKA